MHILYHCNVISILKSILYATYRYLARLLVSPMMPCKPWRGLIRWIWCVGGIDCVRPNQVVLKLRGLRIDLSKWGPLKTFEFRYIAHWERGAFGWRASEDWSYHRLTPAVCASMLQVATLQEKAVESIAFLMESDVSNNWAIHNQQSLMWHFRWNLGAWSMPPGSYHSAFPRVRN